MYDLYPGPARDRRGAARRREHPGRPSRTSTCCAPGSAWCSRSRRRSRCRSTTTSPSACASTSACPSAAMDERVEGGAARRRRSGTRSKDKLRPERPRPVGRAAAAPVHRARDRGQARGHPPRRAVLGARPDLDRQDRGADRRAEGRLHDRDRHPQHAAGGARLAVHRLHVSGRADRVRRDRRRSSPTRASDDPGLHHRPLRLRSRRMAEIDVHAQRAHRPRPSTSEMNELTGNIVEMGGLAERQLADAVEALSARDIELAARVIDRDDPRRRRSRSRSTTPRSACSRPASRWRSTCAIIAMALKISQRPRAHRRLRRQHRQARPAPRPSSRCRRDHAHPAHGARSASACSRTCSTPTSSATSTRRSRSGERDEEVDEIYNSLFRELLDLHARGPAQRSAAAST